MTRGLAMVTTTIAMLAAALVPVGSASAAPRVLFAKHTYRVTYELSGHFAMRIAHGPADGSCADTTYTEDATFDLRATSTITTKRKGDQLTAEKTVKPGVHDMGTWEISGTSYPNGDCTKQPVAEECSGSLGLAGPAGKLSTVTAVGQPTSIVFQVSLKGPPQEIAAATDCDRTSRTIAPAPTFGLLTALAPYSQVALEVPFAKLAYGKTWSRPAGATTVGPGYSLATCDGTPLCSASLSNFKHKLTVKQVS